MMASPSLSNWAYFLSAGAREREAKAMRCSVPLSSCVTILHLPRTVRHHMRVLAVLLGHNELEPLLKSEHSLPP